jgi:uncharacterized protein YkwD
MALHLASSPQRTKRAAVGIAGWSARSHGRRSSRRGWGTRRTCRLTAAARGHGTRAGASSGRRSRERSRRQLRCRVGVRGNRQGTLRARHPLLRPRTAKPAIQARPAQSAIAKVLSTGCQGTELPPDPNDLNVIRGAILCLINKERAQNGEAPLVLNGQLQQAAEAHSRDMIAANYFEHESPGGQTPVDRVRAAGYIPGPGSGYVVGENLAWGTFNLATPQAIVAAWLASPGHLANILERNYSETGIAVIPSVPSALGDGAPGATYTQEFGVITR